MAEHEIDEHSGVATTGHEWDGIKELNNPLPRWWVWTFYACVAFSVIWWVLMPTWPGISGYTKGVLGYTQRATVAKEMAALNESRSASMQQLDNVNTIADVENNPELLQYTIAAGASLFGDNCATCHGSGGQGGPGYPNLNDDDWIWGGTFADIKQTITYGIRSGHPEARFNTMQAYGRDGVLSEDQIGDLVEYVLALSGEQADPAAVERAAVTFEQVCAACHGADGKGNHLLGSPNLTDAIWLYGGERATIYATLKNGRAGVMPTWAERLTSDQITALAVYVHSLGGGE